MSTLRMNTLKYAILAASDQHEPEDVVPMNELNQNNSKVLITKMKQYQRVAFSVTHSFTYTFMIKII